MQSFQLYETSNCCPSTNNDTCNNHRETYYNNRSTDLYQTCVSSIWKKYIKTKDPLKKLARWGLVEWMEPKGSLEPDASLDIWIERRGRGETPENRQSLNSNKFEKRTLLTLYHIFLEGILTLKIWFLLNVVTKRMKCQVCQNQINNPRVGRWNQLEVWFMCFKQSKNDKIWERQEIWIWMLSACWDLWAWLHGLTWWWVAW